MIKNANSEAYLGPAVNSRWYCHTDLPVSVSFMLKVFYYVYSQDISQDWGVTLFQKIGFCLSDKTKWLRKT